MRWDRDPQLYGVPISLRDTSHEFYYTDYPVASVEEWLESVDVGLMVKLDTGLRMSARRARVGDYIELRDEDGWPVDHRFTYDGVAPSDPYAWRRVPFVAASGLDPSPAVAARDAGRLIGWVTCAENNSAGEPYVGQAIVCWATPGEAVLELVETTDGVPVTVAVDLAYAAAHDAASAGARTVATELEAPEFAIVGFRSSADGRRVLDASLLDADPSAAAALLRSSLETPGRWGQDDEAGRYLPDGRARRWWHRAKHGRGGAPPRRYVG